MPAIYEICIENIHLALAINFLFLVSCMSMNSLVAQLLLWFQLLLLQHLNFLRRQIIIFLLYKLCGFVYIQLMIYANKTLKMQVMFQYILSAFSLLDIILSGVRSLVYDHNLSPSHTLKSKYLTALFLNKVFINNDIVFYNFWCCVGYIIYLLLPLQGRKCK